ncbi:hypothetical protein [Pseudomonas sp.]|uniref:hypothetical protein n=1 Tax=Pseudomonas sp. TaxID=306 RepID=UPI003F2F5764
MSDALRCFALPGEDFLQRLDGLRNEDMRPAGALLYQHVPVLGRAITWLKRRMG